MYTSRIQWETLRSVDSSTLSTSYVALGTALLYPSYILKLVNNSTILVTISINGTTDIDIAPAGSFFLYDESKYIAGIGPGAPSIPAGTQIYVKSSTGSGGTGLIYLVSQYLLVAYAI